MLKVDKQFYNELKECHREFDEIYYNIKDMITDEFTQGYLLCMLENIWCELDSIEMNETIVYFIERHVIE